MKSIWLFFLLSLLFFSCEEKSKKIVEPKSDISSDSGNANSNVDAQEKLRLLDSTMILAPIKQIGIEVSLQNFLTKLRKAIISKDTTKLFALIDDSVIVSYGGGLYGKKDFKETYELDNPEKSEFWEYATVFLNYGGVYSDNDEFGTSFVIPYYQSNDLLNNYETGDDWYNVAICMNPKTLVYSKPDLCSKVKGYLRFSLLNCSTKMKSFTQISVPGTNVTGYVKNEDLESLASASFYISKINNEWKIRSFAPFD